MTNYIALIRGINVGGKNKLAMADLKRELQAIGLGRVQTYIQSGNIVFQSDRDAATLQHEIEGAITRIAGFSARVMMLTESQLDAILADCPYAEEAGDEGNRLHLSVLSVPLTEKQIQKLSAGVTELDRYQISDTFIYCHYGQRVLDSKLAGNIGKLGDIVTTRNWNTVQKLGTMIQAMK